MRRRRPRSAPRAPRRPLLRALAALLLCTGAAACSSVPPVPAGRDGGRPQSSASASGTPSPAPEPDTAAYRRILPVPVSARAAAAAFRIGPDTRIHVRAAEGTGEAETDRAARVGDRLADVLRPSTGYRLPLDRSPGPDGIVLSLEEGRDGATAGLGAEGYRLTVTGRAVTIRAARAAGLFHGVQTLRQLLPPAVEEDRRVPGPWTVPGGEVVDRPRYGYRGAMLDVARHFFTPARVRRYIDQLALYKVNHLHLHLTDDQGWRIAVDSRPELTAKGASTAVGGGKGGYYTKAQYRALVRYAADRHITVVPEIDMPGHTTAALASYPELNCDGTAPPVYTGTQVGFSSLCVGRSSTYDFVEDVVREVAELTPGRYLHIGGDEADATAPADYAAFMERAQRIVRDHGKTVVAWHQLAAADPAEGAVVQYWGPAGRDAEQTAAAARAGTRLILSPADHAYLDAKYDPGTELGVTWMGNVEVRRAYDWDPAKLLPGAPASSVTGVEAPLWSETIRTGDEIEYMAFPRLAAVAEIGWSPASSHDWEAFRGRLAAQAPRWEVLGIDYHRSPQVPWAPGSGTAGP
ncbi:beta-N-acetylhexosaminidase [Streptomyces sp. HB2AG]|uniref:beta-N-acetylhexosaminidase n=1 Tax=Streptomyces sp. HB2AG TaxID=2983400 RepID=UPI0022AAB24E|nr:beta-N-acetylhexosaminidase [Streptomyces sp. HB2AG]MCZ2524797.1 beta-N-acetylhexosaminidase [Streptomyces sp. HB2AG]